MSEYLKYGNLRAFLYMQKQVCSDFSTLWVLSRRAFLFSSLFPPSKECLKIEPSESWAPETQLDSVQHRVLIIKMSMFGLNKAKLVSLTFNKRVSTETSVEGRSGLFISEHGYFFCSESFQFFRIPKIIPKLSITSYSLQNESLSDELMLRA